MQTRRPVRPSWRAKGAELEPTRDGRVCLRCVHAYEPRRHGAVCVVLLCVLCRGSVRLLPPCARNYVPRGMGTRASICLGRLWRIRRPLLFARGGLSGRVRCRWLFGIGWSDSEAPWLNYLLWMEFHYSCQGRRRSVPPYAIRVTAIAIRCPA